MKRVLCLDTETTGLNPPADHAIEVGCILYSIEHATVITAYSSLIQGTESPAQYINRISPESLAEAPPAGEVWARVVELAERADAIIAHRAEFDYSFVPKVLQALRPWICSKFDIQWPKQTRPGSSLVELTLEHDLGVAVVHRAMSDCDLLARLFTRSKELGADLDAMLAKAQRPKARFVAYVPIPENDKVKVAGFRWDPIRKEWWRSMFIEEAAALPFKTLQVPL